MLDIDHTPFAEMADDELHAWEFYVFDIVDSGEYKGMELYEIIGVEKAREYFNERGRRLDAEQLVQVQERLKADFKIMYEIEERLYDKSSGKHWFGSGLLRNEERLEDVLWKEA